MCGGPCSAEHVRTLVNPALLVTLTFDPKSGMVWYTRDLTSHSTLKVVSHR